MYFGEDTWIEERKERQDESEAKRAFLLPHRDTIIPRGGKRRIALDPNAINNRAESPSCSLLAGSYSLAGKRRANARRSVLPKEGIRRLRFHEVAYKARHRCARYRDARARLRRSRYLRRVCTRMIAARERGEKARPQFFARQRANSDAAICFTLASYAPADRSSIARLYRPIVLSPRLKARPVCYRAAEKKKKKNKWRDSLRTRARARWYFISLVCDASIGRRNATSMNIHRSRS